MQQTKISLLILTKNEEENIGPILKAIKAWSYDQPNLSIEVAIVDDSSDATTDIARKLGVNVVKGKGKGLGHSYLLGLRWALQHDPRWIITVDGDGQVDLTEMNRFLDCANENQADLVLGSRFIEKGLIQYQYPKANFLGIILLATYLRFISGETITDSHGGIRVYSKKAALSVRLRGQHTYVQESILSVAKSGLKIIEIQSSWLPRAFGTSKVVRSKFQYFCKMAWPLIVSGIECKIHRLRT